MPSIETFLLIIVVLFMAFAVGYWIKKVPRTPSATESEERLAERERRIMRIYQNLEDLMQGFEEFVDEEKAAMAQERRDLIALMDEARKIVSVSPPEPVISIPEKPVRRGRSAKAKTVEPPIPPIEQVINEVEPPRFDLLVEEDEIAAEPPIQRPRSAPASRNHVDAALDAIFSSSAATSDEQPLRPGPLPDLRPARQRPQQRRDEEPPMQAATAAARLEAARRLEPSRRVEPIGRIEGPGRVSLQPERRISQPSWQVLSSQGEASRGRAAKAERVLALRRQGMEAAAISHQLGMALAEVELIIDMSNMQGRNQR